MTPFLQLCLLVNGLQFNRLKTTLPWMACRRRKQYSSLIRRFFCCHLKTWKEARFENELAVCKELVAWQRQSDPQVVVFKYQQARNKYATLNYPSWMPRHDQQVNRVTFQHLKNKNYVIEPRSSHGEVPRKPGDGTNPVLEHSVRLLPLHVKVPCMLPVLWMSEASTKA